MEAYVPRELSPVDADDFDLYLHSNKCHGRDSDEQTFKRCKQNSDETDFL